MATFKNISPLGAIDFPLIGREGEPFGEHGTGCLEPGEVFEIPDELAGQAPSGSVEDGTYDPGWGPLAQPDLFELVSAAKPRESKRTTKSKPKPATVGEPGPEVVELPADADPAQEG